MRRRSARPGADPYWRLGDTSGTTAADAVGAHDGTYLGGYRLGVPGGLLDDPNAAASFEGTGEVKTALAGNDI